MATLRSASSPVLPYAHPGVRDLAFLLTCPPPIYFGPPCPRVRLLGDDGHARLAALDRSPAPLLARLAALPRLRLGHYAEQLLLFWFELAPHIELVAHGLALRDAAGITLGEFDFILRLDGEPWHLETASKFYLQSAATGGALIGSGLNDAWTIKASKLLQQLALSAHPRARNVLPGDFANCRRELLLAGWFFTPAEPWAASGSVSHGWCAQLDAPWPRVSADSRWVHLARARWLSPARVLKDETWAEADLRKQLQPLTQVPQLLAELVEDEDGMWIEVARGFAIPEGWPDPLRLAELLARVASLEVVP